MRGAIVLLTLAAGAATAQDRPAGWTGELVVGKKYADEITFGDQVNGKQEWFEFRGIYPIRVREDRDGWLRVFDGHREGWAKKDEFVLSKDAPAYFTERVRADPNDRFAWMQRGHGWKGRGEYDNAIKDYSEAIRIDPESFDAFNSRGVCWSRKKDEDRAIKDYDEAIRLHPTYSLAFHNRGLSWRNKGDLDRAVRDHTESIRLDPRHLNAYEGRAQVRLMKGEFRLAMADFEKVSELDPNHPNARRELAQLALELGDVSRARAELDALVRQTPKSADVYSSRADVRYRLAEFDTAVSDFDEALQLDPKHAWAPFGRAAALFAAGKSGAVDGCRKLVEPPGPMTTYAVILGHLAARRDKDEAAAKWFLAGADKLKDEWPEPVVRFLRGDLDETGLLKLATDKDKETETRAYLGLDHVIRGNRDAARAHLRWVKDYGVQKRVPYTLAVTELARLEKAGPPSNP